VGDRLLKKNGSSTGIGVIIVLAGVPVHFLIQKSSSSSTVQKYSGTSFTDFYHFR
jgi:hypothetical protein